MTATPRISPSGPVLQIAPSGSVEPLTNAFYVDPARLDSTQNGSIAQPFLTPQQAIDAAAFDQSKDIFTILLAPGDYSSMDIDVFSPESGGPTNIVIEGMSGSSPLGNGVPMVMLNDIDIHNGSEGGAFSTELRNIRCQSLHINGNAILRNVYPITSNITLVGANAVITTEDLYQMRQFGSNSPPSGIKAVNTGIGVTFTVPALAGSFADVTVDVSGSPAFVDLRVGDAVVATTTTRLAGVGIVDAFCDSTGLLTLRFFGTTTGGDIVINFSIVPMSC
jgi:hypothetical protein